MSKTLAIYDMDGTLINSPEKEEGKQIWKEKTGEEYPHKGWWGRRESLNTDIFDIKPIPAVHSKFKKDVADSDTYTVILTARLEKLRPEVENVLNLNGIQPDKLILKKGNETKGDVILKLIESMPDLEKIEVYEDFAGGMEHKIKELTDIENKIPEGIEYNIFYVNDGTIDLMESNNKVLNLIQEELRNLKQ